MTRGRWILALLLVAAPLSAQRGRFNPGFRVDPTIEKIPYDGRFTLVRLSFTTNSPMGFYYRGLEALIISAALDAGFTRLYSEELQHGQQIENLVIENPFRQ